ncbi:MAG TPA: HAMP domain-containing sensor histidine kinase [Candidatus Fermentibacter daniensis]|jgi:signal transduction histidine kinase|nr:MAG: hypothetical protein AO394_04280 [Candidatus Fermentibacter daniensis]MBP7719390.1 HAMP domain-containing histidine kinase [Candidatus Fermentibacter sp.]KZD19975.1 MAG: hypothetical protein AO396_07570 [Candidatus Fermentibacter daniensis]NLI02022.1 HAMP domain-containing histidine kinase [Candidatus Fermentibacter daniensis]HOA05311.1 HAMP domain-containing sensor histidine kinase [Candidatus Fermentibacter daniensis]
MKFSGVRVAVLLLAGMLAWVFLFYSHSLVNRLEASNRLSNETIARFWAGTQVPFSMILEDRRIAVCSGCGSSMNFATQSDELMRYCEICDEVTRWHVVDRWTGDERDKILGHTRYLFRDLIARLNYTTILSDRDMVPQIVNGEPLPDTISEKDLISWREITGKLDEFNPPIPVVTMESDTIGWLHYGVGKLNRELTFVPFIELGVLIILAAVMFFGVRMELRREQAMSWVAFAKETAHQLSTPISSLLGWVEILKQRNGIEAKSDPEILEAAESMAGDLARLNQIVQRYGEMGKKPRLSPADINTEIAKAVSYFRDRPELVFEGIEFETSLEATRSVMLNQVLFGWVLENLIKNALTALGGSPGGLVAVSTADLPEKGGMVEVRVSDNGRGIPHRDQGRIFQPGFTTRRGGWGLGLTLSKRIVEEYHGGSIWLVASSPGKGASFGILIPAVKEVEDAEPDNDTLGR